MTVEAFDALTVLKILHVERFTEGMGTLITELNNACISSFSRGSWIFHSYHRVFKADLKWEPISTSKTLVQSVIKIQALQLTIMLAEEYDVMFGNYLIASLDVFVKVILKEFKSTRYVNVWKTKTNDVENCLSLQLFVSRKCSSF